MAPLFFLATLLATSATPDIPVVPAKSEGEVWTLVQKVRARKAFEIYRIRFPSTPHRDAAVEEFYRAQGIPIIYAPPPPPAPPRVIMPLPTTFVPDSCVKLLIAHELGEILSEEASDYLAAKRDNRVSDYQAFNSKYPAGACRSAADETIKMREGRQKYLETIAGFGPLAAHRMTRNFMTTDDYPISAMRNNEQGRVVAKWEVSDDGVVEMCRIVETSRSKALDDATCRIIARRVRYDPARNAAGVPVRATDGMTITWSLPTGASMAGNSAIPTR